MKNLGGEGSNEEVVYLEDLETTTTQVKEDEKSQTFTVTATKATKRSAPSVSRSAPRLRQSILMEMMRGGSSNKSADAGPSAEDLVSDPAQREVIERVLDRLSGGRR